MYFCHILIHGKNSIQSRAGDFTLNARSRMFISWQTFEGFKITTHAVIEAIKYLLQQGAEFVLSERFCQDPLEEYFGNQRQLGRRSDMPDMFKFGYNDNTIRIQKSVSFTSGNTRGRYDKRKNWVNIDDAPVPKRKSKRSKK